ncbi:glycosyltransferase 87 family protein [Micromonospora sp. 4G57]|uniref:Glycosyltransferase 87 family protein n=1 Tax=Micromonospora sicca TaxID=2202420 RepID=A0ABU5JK47_9ACTN|nr:MULTISPECIES: glycosyltransferase 87 family protein [unclassified Micromonospora]MDZ5446099.1 glycosyltransferase 87 family protein [Micromonospora sp. 4G57]MDZ5492768.1 glycosyltransferase 87 family protein [Micromonospora sp. 4G53]
MPAEPVAPPAVTDDDPGGRTVRRLVTVVALAAVLPALYLPGRVHDFFDLKIYMRAMDWWAGGHPLYDYVQPDRVQGALYFTYPPLSALLLRPFALLPLGATVAIFTILTGIGVMVTTRWLVLPVVERHHLPRLFGLTVAVLLAFAVESTRETITFGQINMLLVVLILADLLFAVPQGRRWAGVGVGLATALKLYPGIFILYLLVTRRWWAAAVAAATAALATLLAAAVAPADSWRFWTQELWATDRVGRTDYTGNQSLFGLLSRITAPEKPSQLPWLLLVVVVTGFGLWRAARAARAGDALAGLTLTGLVGGLVSPITWTHHLYWFIPAVVVLVDAALDTDRGAAEGVRQRRWLLTLAVGTAFVIIYGVVSFQDWGVAPARTDNPGEFVARNAYVLLSLLLLAVLPTRLRRRSAEPPATS